MGLFKSAEEKAAARVQRAQERFTRSPVGRATTAHERGDALFQISLQVDETSAQTLSQIEAIGWHLEHAGYAFIVSSASTSNADGVLADLHMGGELTGVYVFRRPPEPN